MHTLAELAMRPLTNHWLLSVKGVTHYTFMYDPMHCQDIGSSSHVVANVVYDVYYKEIKGNTNQKSRELNKLVREAYNSAKVDPDTRVKWVNVLFVIPEHPTRIIQICNTVRSRPGKCDT